MFLGFSCSCCLFLEGMLIADKHLVCCFFNCCSLLCIIVYYEDVLFKFKMEMTISSLDTTCWSMYNNETIFPEHENHS